MITLTAVDWDGDGDPTSSWATGRPRGAGRASAIGVSAAVYFQQEAERVKFGALVTPVAHDWDGDGDEDLIAGNTAGRIAFIENLDGGDPPRWAAPKLLEAGGATIRILAGPNGSIQGPAEAKWGYTTLSVADWDGDGLADLIVNSIWGKVVWYRNVGSRNRPALAAAAPVQTDEPVKPRWTWWTPAPHELVTQWRTTPVATDWNRDGRMDLLMLDAEGYLALFERQADGRVKAGARIFEADGQAPLRLNEGVAGRSGRRKLAGRWDGDGRLDLLVNSRADWLRNLGENRWEHMGALATEEARRPHHQPDDGRLERRRRS